MITVAILAVLRGAAREIYRRLMDAVNPALVNQAEHTLRATAGVLDVGQVRLRWIGHNLRAEWGGRRGRCGQRGAGAPGGGGRGAPAAGTRCRG